MLSPRTAPFPRLTVSHFVFSTLIYIHSLRAVRSQRARLRNFRRVRPAKVNNLAFKRECGVSVGLKVRLKDFRLRLIISSDEGSPGLTLRDKQSDSSLTSTTLMPDSQEKLSSPASQTCLSQPRRPRAASQSPQKRRNADPPSQRLSISPAAPI